MKQKMRQIKTISHLIPLRAIAIQHILQSKSLTDMTDDKNDDDDVDGNDDNDDV